MQTSKMSCVLLVTGPPRSSEMGWEGTNSPHPTQMSATETAVWRRVFRGLEALLIILGCFPWRSGCRGYGRSVCLQSRYRGRRASSLRKCVSLRTLQIGTRYQRGGGEENKGTKVASRKGGRMETRQGSKAKLRG